MDFHFTTYKKDFGHLIFPKGEEYGNDEQKAVEFLKVWFAEFARLCNVYISHDLGDAPYDYSERQLDSCLLPALSTICNGVVLAELPLNRHRRGNEDDSSGRVDYWCHYKGISFLIEVKHSEWRGSLTKKAKHRWEVMTDYQLKAFRKSEIKNNAMVGKKCIPIGLHFLTSYKDVERKEELERMYDCHIKEFPKLAPNFCCSWEPISDPGNLACKRVAMIAKINKAFEE